MLDIPESGHLILAGPGEVVDHEAFTTYQSRLLVGREGIPNITHTSVMCGDFHCGSQIPRYLRISFADCQAVDLIGPAQYGFPGASLDVFGLTRGDLPVRKPRNGAPGSAHSKAFKGQVRLFGPLCLELVNTIQVHEVVS